MRLAVHRNRFYQLIRHHRNSLPPHFGLEEAVSAEAEDAETGEPPIS
jgi:hypothetical protein